MLITATVFGADDKVGFLSTGALVLLAMYFLSAFGAIGAAAVLRRTVLRGPRPTMVLELPPYRWPVWRNPLTASKRTLTQRCCRTTSASVLKAGLPCKSGARITSMNFWPSVM